ncbi:MAG: coenzyme F420-0:L-glutamate ligase [Candidatus Hodarchaeales archaeon]
MIQIIPVKTKILRPGENLKEFIMQSLLEQEKKLHSRDIIVISSKLVAISQNRVVDLKEYSPTSSIELEKSELDPRFISLVIQEADEIIGSVPGAILTLKDGILLANAGVDQSNATGEGKAILLPENPENVAINIFSFLEKEYNCQLGVIVADSATRPLRRGTTGMAIATAGFDPVIDERGKVDLYGREMRITTRALADNLVTAAQILMGESNESTPIVIIHDLPENMFKRVNNLSTQIEPNKCLFFGNLVYDDLKKRLES